ANKFNNNTLNDSKSSKQSLAKKERRGKLSLITGLTRQKESSTSIITTTTTTTTSSSSFSQLESSSANLSNNSIYTPKPTLDPHSLSEHLDALTDRSAIDPIEISKLNQYRFQASTKPSDHFHIQQSQQLPQPQQQQPTKSKKLTFNSDSKMGWKKHTTLDLSSHPNPKASSITSQLALGPGAAMNTQGFGFGQWKLVQGVITEDGHFTLYSSNDIILHRIYLPSYRRTDIRMVHQSIFGRPHCGVITRRTTANPHSTTTTTTTTTTANAQMTPSMLTSSTSLPLNTSAASLYPTSNGSLSSLSPNSFTAFTNLHQPATPLPHTLSFPKDHQQQTDSSIIGTQDLSIYICMPNSVLLESWLVICKCFCRPDDFRHLYPRSNKKNQVGAPRGSRARVQSLTDNASEPLPSPAFNPHDGTPIKSSPLKQGAPERVRIWRGVEIQLLEGKKLGEPRHITVNNTATVTDPSCAAMGVVANGSRLMSKEDRRNSTGGFLPVGNQTSLLSINKESLFNKSSNLGKHQTAQPPLDPTRPSEHQAEKQTPSLPHHADESNLSTSGFMSSMTSSLNGSNYSSSSVPQLNRQSIQNSLASNNHLEEKPSPSISCTINTPNISAPTLASTPTTSTTTIATSSSDNNHVSSSKHTSLSLNSLNNDHFYFVEFDWDSEIIGRSTIKRNSNPFWSESFKFTEIASFKTPLVLNVYQIKKLVNPSNSKSSSSSNGNHNPFSTTSASPSQITLIGQIHLDFKTLEKNSQLQLWLPIYSNLSSPIDNDSTPTDELYDPRDHLASQKVEIMGEINLAVTVYEQVVLAEAEYTKMVHLLNNDDNIDLPLNLANMATGELDRLSELLIRIYEANNRLFLKLSQLAAIEINGDLSTASILFRANTLLTKMLEAYMRIVGRSFLESSVGPVIRRICMAKIELEIDPSKLKNSLSSHTKEKLINENGKELKKLANEIWQSMYINRSRCPSPLRKIFAKIQRLVGDAYDDQDMRLTSISAFVFLRFFVPAILNPRLFNVIQFQPDSKSQRTLTLVAKTLQGLGNLTLFGIKEPWMSVMNEFITTQLDSFRDYISYIASESDSSKPEWTSKEYEGYGLPYALRASLPPASRDGIPALPHLLDPVRDYSLLASLSSVLPPKTSSKLVDQIVAAAATTTRPRRNTETSEQQPPPPPPPRLSVENTLTMEFFKICLDLNAKSDRRCLKIIQSEARDPTNHHHNKAINSRKWLFKHGSSQLQGTASSLTHARWKRSYTITAASEPVVAAELAHRGAFGGGSPVMGGGIGAGRSSPLGFFGVGGAGGSPELGLGLHKTASLVTRSSATRSFFPSPTLRDKHDTFPHHSIQPAILLPSDAPGLPNPSTSPSTPTSRSNICPPPSSSPL
ncbi:hypothetical protein VP01_668g3, partial [Puccinia sorghi]